MVGGTLGETELCGFRARAGGTAATVPSWLPHAGPSLNLTGQASSAPPPRDSPRPRPPQALPKGLTAAVAEAGLGPHCGLSGKLSNICGPQAGSSWPWYAPCQSPSGPSRHWGQPESVLPRRMPLSPAGGSLRLHPTQFLSCQRLCQQRALQTPGSWQQASGAPCALAKGTRVWYLWQPASVHSMASRTHLQSQHRQQRAWITLSLLPSDPEPVTY